MSHYLCGRESSDPIITIPSRQIISSRCKKNFKLKTSFSKRIEKGMIETMYRNFSNREAQLIKQKNQTFLKTQYEKLKEKMRKSTSSVRGISGCFTTKKQSEHLDMGKINRNWPEVIDINKKYHHQIGCRMLVLRETKNILVDKENYNKWFNSMNNSPVKSPNYNKMNFLLEKLKEKKLLEEVPFRHTADPKTQSPILKPRMTLYKSKHRSIKLKKK